MGNASAVGAAVAVNIALSRVNALFAGDGTISGRAKLAAATYNEDNAQALATAMGLTWTAIWANSGLSKT